MQKIPSCSIGVKGWDVAKIELRRRPLSGGEVAVA